MIYALPNRMNPSMTDVTVGSSTWLASRVRPGRNAAGVSFTHHLVTNGAAARVSPLSDFTGIGSGLAVCVAITNAIRAANVTETNGLEWTGCWTTGGGLIAIGHAEPAHGLVAPFNTFNIGYRYRNRGWRPSRAS